MGMPVETQTKTSPRSSDAQVSSRATRLLLALWFLGGKDVNQGSVTDRVKLKGEKSADCQKFFAQLQADGAIELTDKKPVKVSITERGKKILGQGLSSSALEIEGTVVGAWMAKALLKWIQQSEVVINVNGTNGKTPHAAIASYDEFQHVALEVYDRLNRDYNMGNMVPIYRIRREIGNQVSRSQFNEWLLEMQSNDSFQLLEESVEDSAPDKIEDSITTKLGKLRCYARR